MALNAIALQAAQAAPVQRPQIAVSAKPNDGDGDETNGVDPSNEAAPSPTKPASAGTTTATRGLTINATA